MLLPSACVRQADTKTALYRVLQNYFRVLKDGNCGGGLFSAINGYSADAVLCAKGEYQSEIGIGFFGILRQVTLHNVECLESDI